MRTTPTILISLSNTDGLLDPTTISVNVLNRTLGKDNFALLGPDKDQDPKEVAKVDFWITDYKHLSLYVNITATKILLVTEHTLTPVQLASISKRTNIHMTPIIGLTQLIPQLLVPASTTGGVPAVVANTWKAFEDSISLLATPNLEALINNQNALHVKGNKHHFNYAPDLHIFSWFTTDETFGRTASMQINLDSTSEFYKVIIFHEGVTQNRYVISADKYELILEVVRKINGLYKAPVDTF